MPWWPKNNCYWEVFKSVTRYSRKIIQQYVGYRVFWWSYFYINNWKNMKYWDNKNPQWMSNFYQKKIHGKWPINV